MARNSGAGGKSHKSMKRGSVVERDRSLVYRDIDQDYAKVLKMLGNNRCLVKRNNTDTEVVGIICGRMRKKYVHRISTDDVVLVGVRDFQDDKVDIVHVYTNDEAKMLLEQGELSLKLSNEEEVDESNLMFVQDI
jgi:translation initiation factor 1A